MPFVAAMTALAKICGIRTVDVLDASIAGGADFVGFVFYPRSPRNVSLAEAGDLAARARLQGDRRQGDRRVRTVALTVDADDALLADIVAAMEPDLVQLHGAETPERVADITSRFGVGTMKAISVETAADVGKADAYKSVCDRILFDAKAPKGMSGALPGGNGLSFDWRLMAGVAERMDFMLSGGLNPDNVAAAIRLTGAWAVDVSSGVEDSPGEKSTALIARFLQAVKAAN